MVSCTVCLWSRFKTRWNAILNKTTLAQGLFEQTVPGHEDWKGSNLIQKIGVTRFYPAHYSRHHHAAAQFTNLRSLVNNSMSFTRACCQSCFLSLILRIDTLIISSSQLSSTNNPYAPIVLAVLLVQLRVTRLSIKYLVTSANPIMN